VTTHTGSCLVLLDGPVSRAHDVAPARHRVPEGDTTPSREENTMGDAAEDRRKAAELPEGDVVRVLLEQHARIRDLFTEVKSETGDHKKHAFDELRGLLAVHETAEEMVLRPATKSADGDRGSQVAEARNHEESEANEVLKKLESLDVESAEFDERLAEFEKAVDSHAEAEENEEFPLILESCDQDDRQSMGKRMLAAEKIAPTHPHPSTAGSTAKQFAVGPIASLVDRTRDAIGAG
jgi:hemerythrin superfamily protein